VVIVHQPLSALASVSGSRQPSVKVKRGTVCNSPDGEGMIAHGGGLMFPERA
jgi:hypothetical protein